MVADIPPYGYPVRALIVATGKAIGTMESRHTESSR